MTLYIVGITVLVSYWAFRSEPVMNRLQFNASKVYHKHEWYRLLSHAFVHANWEHLIINMLVFYSFGTVLERIFQYEWGAVGVVFYLILYFGAVLFSNVYSLFQHRDDFYYNAVGASGGVSAIIFCNIFFDPWNPVYFFGIIPIPGFLFAMIYLGYSYYMSRKNSDNIGHDAHFLGALFGFLFPIILHPGLFRTFLDRLFMIS
ncbi:MAG: rhomboid family intramembrane serine protease [Bacteroidota bacterium]|nr:rhomboid family intramembrane serine protease [Bacteroidota bacterium]MDP4206125.1 rhomboid family intramembrane serine protease [Bacteroidota bacterium]